MSGPSRRVRAFFFLCAAGAAVFYAASLQLFLPLGILAGASAALVKFRFTALLFCRLTRGGSRKRGALKAALLHSASQIINIILLTLCVKKSIGLFAGCAAGMIIVPLIVAIGEARKANRAKNTPPASTKEPPQGGEF